jgi:hypothetical protein
MIVFTALRAKKGVSKTFIQEHSSFSRIFFVLRISDAVSLILESFFYPKSLYDADSGFEDTLMDSKVHKKGTFDVMCFS